MNKYINYLLLLCGILSSCQSMELLSIDYMMPADISFPPELKRVAIVNNMPNSPEHNPINKKQPVKKDTEILRMTQFYYGDAAQTAESLAQSIANENYFNEVIICDSALRSQDTVPQKRPLSIEDINTLTKQLQVDFLIAIENVQMKALRKIERYAYSTYVGTLDVLVSPTISIYVPNRSKAIATLTLSDSIYWDNVDYGVERVNSKLIKDKDLIREASIFAGTIPVRHLLPYWETTQRHLFTGGTVNMRDAILYVKEKNWPAAVTLWKQDYNKQKGKKKMYAAYNIALGYEMQDSITNALSWAKKAQDIASEIDQVDLKQKNNRVEADNVPNYVVTSMYVVELEKRQANIHMLDMQMGRFKEEEK